MSPRCAADFHISIKHLISALFVIQNIPFLFEIVQTSKHLSETVHISRHHIYAVIASCCVFANYYCYLTIVYPDCTIYYGYLVED